jgi:hypothetical protein
MPKTVRKTSTKKSRTTKPRRQRPQAVAARIADNLANQLTDYHSPLVAHITDEYDMGLTEAVREHRLMMEASGQWTEAKDGEGAQHDDRVAMYLLGFALGAKLGGAR